MRPLTRSGNRRRDAGFFLPLAGFFLLIPPFVNLFTGPTLLWGIPLEVLYLFAVWFALVACAFALSRHDVPDPETKTEPDRDAGTGRAPD